MPGILAIEVQDDGKVILGGYSIDMFDSTPYVGDIFRLDTIPSKTQVVNMVFDGEDFVASSTVKPPTTEFP